MNCAECNELLVASLEGLLDDSQEQAVEEHFKTCGACRAELQDLQTLRQRLVGNGRTLAQSSVEDDVMNRIVREQNARLKSAAQAGAGLRIRRLIMRSSVVKIAVAAAIVVVALGAWSLWSGTQPGVALADVLVKVEQVQAFMYKITMHVKGQMQGSTAIDTDMTGSALIANDYGMRMDMNMNMAGGGTMEQQMYMLPQKKLMMMVMPAMKKYMRMELDDSMFEKMRKQNNDPRLMIKQIVDSEYTALGRSVIDGVEVEGFQTTDPAYGGNVLGDVDVKIWVDVKTQLPVRMDMRIKANEQMEMEGTMYDFQWDVPVSAAEFDPVLPADYTAGPGDGLKIPPMTEETAITGLKLCVELNGKYPDDLNLMTLIQTATKSITDGLDPNTFKVRDPKDAAAVVEAQTKKMADKMMPIQMLGGFYGTLMQEKKEPAYYGKVVTPGDKALVLLRWKTGKNEYRVIFGDLHAETVNAATLATLEAALPK